MRVAPDPVHFEDLIQGPLSYDLRNSCGDFVIWRADGLPAYQLATALDDVNPPISEVVRGADLLDSTPRQIAVRQAMRLGSPRYAHIPVARINGKKLSKRNFDDPISRLNPAPVISSALEFLGLDPPAGLGIADLWQWATTNWKLSKVPGTLHRELHSVSRLRELNAIMKRPGQDLPE